jgi:hypothetical protein
MIDQLLDALSWVPDYATGIWIVLSGLLIYILLMLNKRQNMQTPLFKTGVVLLAIIWLYPLVTPYVYPIESGFLANLLTLGLTVYYFKQLKAQAPKLQLWLLPQLLWLVFSTLYTLGALLSKYAA